MCVCRLLAIMGPSGSGKTTLLNTLAGQLPYQPQMTLTGQVFVNEVGKPKGGGLVAKPAGSGGAADAGFVFVKQEDLFYSHMTVRETLMFTAQLRLPRTMTRKQKAAYVDEMIFRMGLAPVADTLVGDERKRGISGGERKRLSLACELMGNPSKIIFADEPTSGLDAFQAEIVMQSMKKLCREGHTVIVSIHQPRSTVYQMFDGERAAHETAHEWPVGRGVILVDAVRLERALCPCSHEGTLAAI
jgi:ABC-type multidrug transport system ATPase subunit